MGSMQKVIEKSKAILWQRWRRRRWWQKGTAPWCQVWQLVCLLVCLQTAWRQAGCRPESSSRILKCLRFLPVSRCIAESTRFLFFFSNGGASQAFSSIGLHTIRNARLHFWTKIQYLFHEIELIYSQQGSLKIGVFLSSNQISAS